MADRNCETCFYDLHRCWWCGCVVSHNENFCSDQCEDRFRKEFTDAWNRWPR